MQVKEVQDGKQNNKKQVLVMDKFQPDRYAELLFRNYEFRFDKYKRFWVYDYDTGVWSENAEQLIKMKLRQLYFDSNQQKKNYADEVVSYIKDISYVAEDTRMLPVNLIPFQNGIYNLDSGKLEGFDPKYFVTNKIPVMFDIKHITCPKIDKFFSDLVGQEKKCVLYDLFAYCLYRSYPYPKMFLLYGRGENGKSRIPILLTRFLGQRNISNENIHNLLRDRFSPGRLYNKLVNACADLSYGELKSTGILKGLTGEDTLNCDRKHKEPFPFYNYAKLVFCTNELPKTKDKTRAFYRRLYLVEFPNIFTGEDKDPLIIDKITTPEELSGLAHECVCRLKDMRDRGFKFELDPSVDDLEAKYEDLTNPIEKFIKENLKDDFGGFIYKFEFRDRFLEFLKNNGFRKWSEREISKVMKEKYMDGVKNAPFETQKEGDFRRKQWRTWEGLIWK